MTDVEALLELLDRNIEHLLRLEGRLTRLEQWKTHEEESLARASKRSDHSVAIASAIAAGISAIAAIVSLVVMGSGVWGGGLGG